MAELALVCIIRVLFSLPPVSDFSFVSSLINIPFATEEDAITFYSCPAATRYLCACACSVVLIPINAHLMVAAARSVWGRTMRVDGVSTTRSAEEQPTSARQPMKPTG